MALPIAIFGNMLRERSQAKRASARGLDSSKRLPEAEKIEYRVTGEKNNFTGIVTAVRDDAPPIFQWDTAEKRNPYSWYVYTDGPRPE